ncbi:MAG: hypothetical protein F4103_05805, partial [Boseongicola sp. SB0673_bin_14]|nr:hypothetical protein [Boseongicola sp. SB0673_bin_14]
MDEIASLLREDADLAGHVAFVKVGDGNCTPGEIAQDVATAIAEVIGTGLAPDSNFLTSTVFLRNALIANDSHA